MAPVTRSQTAILRSKGHRPIEDTDVDFMRRYAASLGEMKIRVEIAVRCCTRRCLYCGKPFLRERRPRSSKSHSVSEETGRFLREMKVHLRTKTGVHAKKIQDIMQETEGICRELEDVHKTCKALEAMPKRQCYFCFKWSESSPFVYVTRLIRTLKATDSSNLLYKL